MNRLTYICVVSILLNAALAVPVSSDENDSTETYLEDVVNTTESGKDLLVIRQVVYEIGILTNADNSTDTSNDTQEVINVSFYDPGRNGSLFDLSKIPVPVQTNVSGVAVTGVLPANFGVLNLLQNGTFDGTNFPLLPQKQVKISHNISTVDNTKGASILAGIPQLLGLDKLLDEIDDDNNATTTESGNAPV